MKLVNVIHPYVCVFMNSSLAVITVNKTLHRLFILSGLYMYSIRIYCLILLLFDSKAKYLDICLMYCTVKGLQLSFHGATLCRKITIN